VARLARALAAVVLVWALLAYVVLPALWEHHEHNPALATAPYVTRTGDDIPGDPINVALIGTQTELISAMGAAGWHPADPITLRSSVGIIESVLLDRRDPDAPVSNLYLFGRRQDLAFELPVGTSARERHHVRFWRDDDIKSERPVWLGSATFDRSVGLSHLTGQVTHHIGPDIDAERDGLLAGLAAAGRLVTTYEVSGIGPTLNGRNGEGDRYVTDGEIGVGVLRAVGDAASAPPERLPSPAAVQVKNRLWAWLRTLFAR